MDEEQIEACRRKAIGILKAYNDNKVQIGMLQSQIKEISSRTDVGSMAVSYDQPAGGQTNKVSSTVEAVLISKEQQIEQLSNRLAMLQGQVERIDIALSNMPYAQRTLLRLRYIDRQTWRQISTGLDYSEEYLRKQLQRGAIATLTEHLFPAVKECIK